MMKRIYIFTILVISSVFLAKAQYNKADGDSAYVNGNFDKAIEIYNEILKEGEAPEIYYNLGNAYYKRDEIGKSVLNYKRALLLNPSDKNAKANLEIALGKTKDKVIPNSEIFFIEWVKIIGNTLAVEDWAKLSIVSFLLFLSLLSSYLFTKSILVKKISFFAGCAMLAVCIVANLFAFQQRRILIDRTEAVVVQPSITVTSTPSNEGTILFRIHEGHIVKILDSSMTEWYEIELQDGKTGWIPKSAIEIV